MRAPHKPIALSQIIYPTSRRSCRRSHPDAHNTFSIGLAVKGPDEITLFLLYHRKLLCCAVDSFSPKVFPHLQSCLLRPSNLY